MSINRLLIVAAEYVARPVVAAMGMMRLSVDGSMTVLCPGDPECRARGNELDKEMARLARNSLFSPLGDQKGLSWNFAIVELILYTVIKIYCGTIPQSP